MKHPYNRRKFIQLAAMSGAGVAVANSFPLLNANALPLQSQSSINHFPSTTFTPNRVASWWTTIEDLQWPQKQ
ncbi:MAG: twin-arginine translocation signal domain-containing protein, partial [Ferruginibacter sp.]